MIDKEMSLDLIINEDLTSTFQEENDECLRMSKKIDTKLILQFNESKLIKMFSKNTIFEKKLIKIQAFFRMKNTQRLIIIKKKNLNYRKNVINELVKTEEIYVNNLNLIFQEIMVPVKGNKNILDSEQYLILFSNLESIFKFNETFCSELISKFSNFIPQRTKIADIVEKYVPFFRFYFDYCNNFERSNFFLINLKKEKPNHRFLQFLQPLENKATLKYMDLSNYLIKPVQRLPKYALLFKDLFKHTEKDHPDYKNIKSALDMFLEINRENNQKMNNYLKNIKLFELQKLFESGKLIILDPKREFIEEQPLNLVINDTSRSVICYFLSDLILVTEREGTGVNYKLINHLTLGEESSTKEISNIKHFNNLIRVTGKEGSITFTAENSENKEQIINLISKIINNLIVKSEKKKKTFVKMGSTVEAFKESINFKSLGISVNVIGSEERNIADYTRHTIYIIEIELSKIFTQKLFITYSKFRKLQELILNKYKKIKIPNLPKQSWALKKGKTKLIESRMILIENFLQNVLQNDKILKKPESVLEYLNLPLDFYEISQRKAIDKMKKQMIHLSLSDLMKNSNMISLKIRDFSLKENDNKCTANIKVKIIDGGMVDILIHKRMTVKNICEKVARKINLKSEFDYKLYLENSTSSKIIDGEEFLFDLISYEENSKGESKKNIRVSSGARNSLWEKIKEKIVGYFKKAPILVFKKAIFFKREFEEKDEKNDEVRLNLLTAQILNDISNLKFPMEKKEYALFAGIYLFIKKSEYKTLNQNQEIEIRKLISEFIPKIITETIKEEDFGELCLSNWEKITDIINELWKNDLNRITRMSQQEKEYSNKKLILSKFLLINEISKNPLYGVSIFWVEIYHKTVELIEKKWPKFIFLGIKYDEILLISHKNHSILKSFKIMDNNKIEIYHKSIIIIDAKNNKFKFKTYKGYEIHQLILEYKKLLGLESAN